MTVAEMTAKMPSSEITQWMAYAQLHPFDQQANMIEIMLAKIASLIHNGAGRIFKKTAAPADFMMARAAAAPKPPQTKEVMLAAREMLRVGFNAKFKALGKTK